MKARMNKEETMKYIFINPVVAQMYEKESLDKVLLHNGYQRVEVEKDWHGIVKEKYQKLLQETNLPIIDRRCPKAVESIAPYLDSKKMVVPTIEPILIHCAMELAGREDLKKYREAPYLD